MTSQHRPQKEQKPPPEETPPDPNPTKPHTDPAPVDPQPGTSKAPTGDPTQAPTDDLTQLTAKNPDEDEPPALTKYVMEYKAAGKAWLDSVVKDQEEAYIKLFDKLMELGSPYIDNFDQADREQVFKCITGNAKIALTITTQFICCAMHNKTLPKVPRF